jgi:hypothetical protein
LQQRCELQRVAGQRRNNAANCSALPTSAANCSALPTSAATTLRAAALQWSAAELYTSDVRRNFSDFR